MQIGTVKIESKLALAPMAGVTDAAFRQICSEKGAGYTVTELVSAKALCYHDTKTAQLLRPFPGEKPFAAQIFGSDVNCMAEAAQMAIEISGADILDINMGCPVPKVVNNGEGSALMKNPKLVEEIISRTVKAIHKPVTVKFRKGFDEEHINAVEIARIAEQSGAAAVAVHGRTREQYYAGKADWDIIAQVKAAVSIPVFGNGDVTDGKSAAALLQQTGCDGVMIGRAVRGNPWIFREINHYLDTGELPERPTADEVCNTILRHAQMELELKGEYTAVREMRKHIAWYTAGYPRSAALRRKVNEIEDFETLKETVQQIFTE